MFRRHDYKPVSEMNDRNEPPILSTAPYINYPDMYEAYNAFRELLDIPKDCDFILGNGAENVVKNVLLALRPKTLHFSVPTWGMLDVFCAQLNIKPKKYELFDIGTRIVEPKIKVKKDDVYYGCKGINNYCKYIPSPHLPYVKQIIDMSYFNIGQVNAKLTALGDNEIVVGSLGKIFGCGLRLGYAVFKKTFKEIQLQRENFLNQYAVDFLTQRLFSQKVIRLSFDLDKLNPVFVTPNYCVFEGHLLAENYPHTHFTIGHAKFTRMALPKTNIDYKKLQEAVGYKTMFRNFFRKESILRESGIYSSNKILTLEPRK